MVPPLFFHLTQCFPNIARLVRHRVCMPQAPLNRVQDDDTCQAAIRCANKVGAQSQAVRLHRSVHIVSLR